MNVYTAIAGKYPIERRDIQCFTGDGIFQNPVMEAKRYKVLSHLFFDGPTIWMDGNISLRADADLVASSLLGDADIALITHPYRRTVWEEFKALREQQRFRIPYLQKQLAEQEKFYRADGLPPDIGLFECNVLVRRNTERVRRLMDAWWSQICRWQWRDQVSLPYVLWKYGDGLRIATGTNVRTNPLFDYVDQY